MFISSEDSFDLMGDISYTFNKSDYPKKHCHNYWECFIVTDGEAIHTVNDKKYLIKKNDFWIIKPNQLHSFTMHKKKTFSRLNIMSTCKEVIKISKIIGKEVYQSLLEYQGTLCVELEKNEAERFSAVAVKHMTLANNCSYSDEMLRVLFIKILIKAFDSFIAKPNDYPAWLNEFIAKLSQQEFLKMKIKDIYKLSNYSYPQLQKLFKHYTGQNLLDYFKNIKLSYARELLKKTNYSCADIAEAVGYSSNSHFVCTFKDKYGVTPHTYRLLK